jgi:hypothetical protein
MMELVSDARLDSLQPQLFCLFATSCGLDTSSGFGWLASVQMRVREPGQNRRGWTGQCRVGLRLTGQFAGRPGGAYRAAPCNEWLVSSIVMP